MGATMVMMVVAMVVVTMERVGGWWAMVRCDDVGVR